MIPRYLELLNGALGLALLILTAIIARDFRKELSGKAARIQILLAFFGLSILVFSFKELYKYGPFDTTADPVIAELLETSYLFLTLIAAFLLLGLRK